MKNFEELLQKELDKLPYTKHLDDRQIAGFELGARWALKLFAVSWRKELLCQLVHEGILDNKEIIKIVQYLFNDILQAKTRTLYSKSHKGCYNSHQFAKGERFKLCGKEFITDNE
jgi:hypothetical protein